MIHEVQDKVKEKKVRQSAPNGGSVVAVKKVKHGSQAEKNKLVPGMLLVSVQVCVRACGGGGGGLGVGAGGGGVGWGWVCVFVHMLETENDVKDV